MMLSNSCLDSHLSTFRSKTRERTKKASGPTARSLGPCCPFLRSCGPREVKSYSLLKFYPTEILSHYFAASFHWLIYLKLLHIQFFRGNLLCGPIYFSTRREKRSKSTVQSPQVSTQQFTPWGGPSQQVNSGLRGTVQPCEIHIGISEHLLADITSTF